VWLGGAAPLRVQDLLATYGLNLFGYSLERVVSISNDGATLVGNARDASNRLRAWLARIPAVGGPFVCGNGVVAGNEDCDDGNTLSGDGCSATCALESCANGLDDDADGLVDLADPECDDAADRTEAVVVECADGRDDDGDGLVDLADTGCASASDLSERDPTQPCDDGADDDGDLYVDFPNDPACLSPAFSRESSECQNAIDDDGAAGVDYDGGASFNGGVALGPADSDCAGKPQRDKEIALPACGLGAELLLFAPAYVRLRRRTASRVSAA
jgi:cysteine-rich repeat protein